MSWGKLAHGTIHLYSLYGKEGPAGPLVTERGSAAGQSQQQCRSSEHVPEAGPTCRSAVLVGRFPQMLRNLLSESPPPARMWDLEAAVLRLGWGSSLQEEDKVGSEE